MSFIDSNATAYDWTNGERISANPDDITFALPNATSVTTDAFRLAKTQSRVEVELVAVEELTIADGTTMTVELLWDADRDGTYSDSKVITAYAPSGSADVVSAGGRIAIETPETNVEHFCKIKVTASADQSATSATVKLHYTA